MKSKTLASKGKMPAPRSKMPVWKYTRAEESELLYLSLAARFHCGQQQPVEPGGLEDDGDSSDDDDDEDAEDRYGLDQSRPVESSVATTADDTVTKFMKQRFLDNFAELLARRKDPRFVSCCVMVEYEKKVKIFVSRNAGFDFDGQDAEGGGEKSIDRTFFDEFRRQILGLHNAYTPADENALLELLVEYYIPRLEHHFKEFVREPDDWKSHSDQGFESQQKRLKEFISFRITAAAYSHEGLYVERAQELAMAAYKLTRSSEIRPAVHRLFETGTAERVLRQMRFLARIRAIHLSILDCIHAFPNFGKLEIMSIPYAESEPVTKDSIRLARTAALASLQKYLGFVPAWMNNPDRLKKFEAEYYNHPLIMHAEMRMACFFEQNREYTPFPYLGISKKTCYLCHQFLSQPLTFKTRTSHGQLHPYWTLLIGMQIRKGRIYSPMMAFEGLRQQLAEMIGRNNVKKLAYRPESSAVWSGRPAMSSGPASLTASRISHLQVPKQTHNRPEPSAKRPGKALLLHTPAIEGTLPSQKTFDSSQTATTSYLGEDAIDMAKLKVALMKKLLEIHYDKLPVEVQRALPLLQLES